MASLTERMLKSSTLGKQLVKTMDDSILYTAADISSTPVPMLNVALSGSTTGGLTSGVTIFAGESRNFKTLLGLVCVAAYLNEHKDGICLFYDTEFGTPDDYFTSLGIDKTRVVHCPVTDMEQLKFDMMAQLKEIERGDKVIMFVDSIGNLASKKEVEDAENQKSVADMTRAKQLKSLFRMVTPHLTLKNIPLVAINHTYKEQSLFPKNIMSGGTGPMYSASTVIFIGKQQNKVGTDLIGYNFILNIEKSRYVREKSKIPLTVTFDKGVDVWSGLLGIAAELGIVTKPSMGWYACPAAHGDKKFREKDTHCKEFWNPIFEKTNLCEAIGNYYSLRIDNMIATDKEK